MHMICVAQWTLKTVFLMEISGFLSGNHSNLHVLLLAASLSPWDFSPSVVFFLVVHVVD